MDVAHQILPEQLRDREPERLGHGRVDAQQAPLHVADAERVEREREEALELLLRDAAGGDLARELAGARLDQPFELVARHVGHVEHVEHPVEGGRHDAEFVTPVEAQPAPPIACRHGLGDRDELLERRRHVAGGDGRPQQHGQQDQQGGEQHPRLHAARGLQGLGRLLAQLAHRIVAVADDARTGHLPEQRQHERVAQRPRLFRRRPGGGPEPVPALGEAGEGAREVVQLAELRRFARELRRLARVGRQVEARLRGLEGGRELGAEGREQPRAVRVARGPGGHRRRSRGALDRGDRQQLELREGLHHLLRRGGLGHRGGHELLDVLLDRPRLPQVDDGLDGDQGHDADQRQPQVASNAHRVPSGDLGDGERRRPGRGREGAH
jgi:hypothetical protein